MQMQNLLKVSNKIKKSHALLVGSLLIFLGIVSLSWNYFAKIKSQIYSDMNIAMMDDTEQIEITNGQVTETAVAESVDVESNNTNYVVDYSKYLGVLEIPKIGLKRGFYNIGSKYNNIQYNVTMVDGSTLPDVNNGNLILMAHSGDAYISYFAYLYRLGIGDLVYVTYAGRKYVYQIVNIYDVDKIGVVKIIRNYDRTTLTMITCTKGNNYTQTIYISELIG